MAYITVEAAIRDLLAAAFQFDEKPHRLFSTIRRIAKEYETDSDIRAETIALMDRAYDSIGAARAVWAGQDSTS